MLAKYFFLHLQDRDGRDGQNGARLFISLSLTIPIYFKDINLSIVQYSNMFRGA